MKKIAILPKLYDAYGNIQKNWFVFYSFRDPASNKMQRFKVFEGLNILKTKKERYAKAESMINDLTFKIKQGWNPFEENKEKFVFENKLLPHYVAKMHKNEHAIGRTFSVVSSLFLPEMKGMAPKTYAAYVSKYRAFEFWLQQNCLDKLTIAEITPQMVREFVLHLINDQKLARLTVEKYKSMLHSLFQWCIAKHYITTNPCVDLPTTRRTNDQTARPVHEDDIVKLAIAIRENDPQLWLAIQMEYYCYLRPGNEIRFARVGWFDLARGTISVPAEFVKTKRPKTVVIPNQFRDSLLNEFKLHLYPVDYYVMGVNGVPGYQPVAVNSLRIRFNRIRDILQLPKQYKLYSWKHTGNIRAAEADIPMFHIKEQNGHLSMQTTEIYMKNKVGFISEEIRTKFPTLEDGKLPPIKPLHIDENSLAKN